MKYQQLGQSHCLLIDAFHIRVFRISHFFSQHKAATGYAVDTYYEISEVLRTQAEGYFIRFPFYAIAERDINIFLTATRNRDDGYVIVIGALDGSGFDAIWLRREAEDWVHRKNSWGPFQLNEFFIEMTTGKGRVAFNRFSINYRFFFSRWTILCASKRTGIPPDFNRVRFESNSYKILWIWRLVQRDKLLLRLSTEYFTAFKPSTTRCSEETHKTGKRSMEK